MLDFDIVLPPTRVYRVARWPGNPFTPPPWAIARGDGTFGNRFDDPGANDASPNENRFRIISCATQREAAIGESIARFRPSLPLLSRLTRFPDPEAVDAGKSEPGASPNLEAGSVPIDWTSKRQMGSTRLDPTLLFVDLSSARSLTVLRTNLAHVADHLGISDIDLSSITGPQRAFTQACSRFIYEQQSIDGTPRFAGIRYVSRLHLGWECWAIFADRMWHEPDQPSSIDQVDPDVLHAATLLGLSVERE